MISARYDAPVIPDHARRLLGKTLREKWTLDAFLGEGGNAVVFAATHRNGMRGAVKILHGHLTASADTKRRLTREGYVANKIEHPGVVRVLDDDETDEGLAFIVMELLEGETWKQHWLREGRALSVVDVLTVASQVLAILSAAHRADVIHRDVKPDNVFLVSGGGVKLLDFGIARFRGAADATQTGRMLGTPAFMSPEQALARWKDVDARSDLFSLGATMRALLSGQPLHVYSTLPELLIAAATRPVAPLATLLPAAPAQLVEIIDRAVAFEPAQRWASADRMREAVDAMLATAPKEQLGVLCQLPTASTQVVSSTLRAALGEIAEEESPPASLGTREASRAAANRPVDAEDSISAAYATLASADASARAGQPPASSTQQAPPRRWLQPALAVGLVGVVAAAGIWIGRVTTAPSEPNPNLPAADVARSAVETATPTAPTVIPKDPPSASSAAPSVTIVASQPRPRVASVRPTASATSSAKTRPFNAQLARATVDRFAINAANACRGMTGAKTVPVTVTFHPDGSSTPSIRPEHHQTQAGFCVKPLMKPAIPAYDGADEPVPAVVMIP